MTQNFSKYLVSISLMKQQFVATHTIHQTEIPTLLDSWVTTYLLSNYCDHQKNLLLLIFL